MREGRSVQWLGKVGWLRVIRGRMGRGGDGLFNAGEFYCGV